jgi:predicted secreted protein
MAKILSLLCLVPAAVVLFGPPALAENDCSAQCRGTVISLDSRAMREIPNDLMRVSYFVEMEDTDPAHLASSVNAAATDAIKIAKQVKEVKVQTSGYQTYPVRDKSNKIVRWRARYEFFVEGKDFKELSELTGRLQQTIQVAGIGFSVSPETRAKVEDALIDEAVAAFRRRAALIARSAGIGDYRIRDMTVSADGYTPPHPVQRMAMAAAEAMPAPVEAGVSTVSLRVSGAIESPPPAAPR